MERLTLKPVTRQSYYHSKNFRIIQGITRFKNLYLETTDPGNLQEKKTTVMVFSGRQIQVCWKRKSTQIKDKLMHS